MFFVCGLPALPDAQCTWQLPQDVFLPCPTCSVLVQIRIPGIAGVEHPWMTAYAVDMRYSTCSKHTQRVSNSRNNIFEIVCKEGGLRWGGNKTTEV
jgi:hypothetical protein